MKRQRFVEADQLWLLPIGTTVVLAKENRYVALPVGSLGRIVELDGRGRAIGVAWGSERAGTRYTSDWFTQNYFAILEDYEPNEWADLFEVT